MVIYLDESGDLGFGKGATKNFVILFMVANNEIDLKRQVRRVKKKHKIPRGVEIKAATSSPRLRREMLKSVAQTDTEIYSIITYKPRVHEPDLIRTSFITMPQGYCSFHTLSKKHLSGSRLW